MQVEIQIRCFRFYTRIFGIKKFCNTVIQNAWGGDSRAEVSVVLADDDFVHQLNRQYRGIDRATNVLSFENEGLCAGDIVIAYQTTLREAREKHISFRAHLAHLLTHGTLHLQGYDHLTDRQANQMEKQEIKLMKKLGYKNPYQE